jgi:hypothetical protein
MVQVPFDAVRVRTWWPWIALLLGLVVIAVGGLLFSATP